ncbi:MAG TPA: class I SAM-dependent methyltransferase [Mycobacterium sp.]
MARTDDDSWDITESVGATALGVAMARAAETASRRPLFVDHYAQWFIDAAVAQGWESPFGTAAEPVPQVQQRVKTIWAYAAARTKHFDDFFIAAGSAGIRQVVILAAGLDARAWRLPWIAETVVYEIDQPKVLEFKSETLRAHGAKAAARDVAIPIDLRQDWPTALRAAGFDASEPTAWLAEGLLPYLPAAGQDLLFERVQHLSAPDSRIAVECFGPDYYDPEYQEKRRAAMQEMRDAVASTGRQMTDVSELFFNEPRADVPDWLAEHGWEVDSIEAAELMARHKRERVSEMLENRSLFVEARRLAGP